MSPEVLHAFFSELEKTAISTAMLGRYAAGRAAQGVPSARALVRGLKTTPATTSRGVMASPLSQPLAHTTEAGQAARRTTALQGYKNPRLASGAGPSHSFLMNPERSMVPGSMYSSGTGVTRTGTQLTGQATGLQSPGAIRKARPIPAAPRQGTRMTAVQVPPSSGRLGNPYDKTVMANAPQVLPQVAA